MFDINEIKKRAQQASERAADAMKETFEKSEEIVKKAEEPDSKKSSSVSAAEVEEQIAANTQRQVEILGQMFGADGMAQMAVNEELLQKMVNDKVAEATASTAETFMGQLFGEDMGVLAAALETLETHTRMGLFRGSYQHGVVCSTYRTAHYMVSGLVESKANEHGGQVNAGQALLEDDVPVFVTCFADRSPTTRPSYFGGQYIIPKTIAYRNILAYMAHIPSELGFTHCYFPQKQMDEVRVEKNWIFGKKGGAYIAVYCSAPYTQVKGGAYNQRELLSMAKDITWLFELGDADAWGSFDAFVRSICAAHLEKNGDTLVYQSPSAGVLRLSWSSACTHDGQPFVRENAPLIENPLAYGEYGSGKITLSTGQVMDFFA